MYSSLMKGGLRAALVCCMSLMSSKHSFAHHSLFGYDMEGPLELEGELVEIMWKNPHVGFVVNIANEQGVEEPWSVSGHGSLYGLVRTGVSREDFNVGDWVKLYGYPSVVSPNTFLATNMLLPGGIEAITKADKEPHWSTTTLGGRDKWVPEESTLPDTAAENVGIFRVWSPAGYADVESPMRFHLPFTEQALAARESWDPLDNWILRCEPDGMPVAMFVPHPFMFEDGGGYILLHGEFGDITRTIILDPANSGDAPSSVTALGRSVGRWEGRTLVVETTDVDFPYFDRIGTPQSEAVAITEEFALSEDQSTINYRAVVRDPPTFTEPAVIEARWVALGENFPEFNCEVF